MINIAENVIISASEDHTIKIWDWEQSMCLFTFVDHSGPIKSLLKCDKDIFVSGGLDKALYVYNW